MKKLHRDIPNQTPAKSKEITFHPYFKEIEWWKENPSQFQNVNRISTKITTFKKKEIFFRQTIVIFLVIHFAEIILGQDANWFWTCKDAVNPRQRKYGNWKARWRIVSFTNPLAAESGLVERTPKKVRFSLWTPVVKKIYIAAGKLGTYSELSTHELSKNHIEK